MKKNTIISLLLLVIVFSCSKKEIIPSYTPPPPTPEQYERFIGEYKVYDTLSNFIYDMNIVHYFSGNNIYGNSVDSVILLNFADTFDVKYEFIKIIDKDYLEIGIFDSIVDKNNKSWNLSGQSDDPTTLVRENKLINDTIIMYFRQTNIKYYIPELQPYFFCKCKHVAVKQ